MSDVLCMEYINNLPQPFLVRFCGDKEWWPVHDFEVGTGLMRIDVCGKLQVKQFSEVMEIQDGDGVKQDPDLFYNDFPSAEALMDKAREEGRGTYNLGLARTLNPYMSRQLRDAWFEGYDG